MLLFFSLCFCLCLFGVWTVSKKNISRKSAEKLFMQISFVVLFVITGFRGLTVGNDTPMYVNYFMKLNGLGSLAQSKNRYELGYRFFNCLIAQFFSNPHALLIIAALVTIGLLYKMFINESEVPVYSVLMYVGLTMYYSSLTMMRQYVAIALCTIAYLYLIEKQRLKFALLVILAAFFHTTAFVILVMLPLSMLPYQKNKRYWYILFGLIATVFFNYLVRGVIILFPRYEGYLNGDNYYIAGKLGSVIKALIYSILFWIYDHLYRIYGADTEENKILYFCGLMGAVLTVASIQGAILSRIASYFNIMFCVSIPNAMSWIPDRYKKYIWAASILAGIYAYNMVVLYFRPNWTGALPYTFWK